MVKKLFDEENDFSKDSYEPEIDIFEEFSEKSDDEFEFENFGDFAIDDVWAEKIGGGYNNSHEEYENQLLQENLKEIFDQSDFKDKYDSLKKVPKHELTYVYLYFYDRIKEADRFTIVEKFIAIAEFMKMNYANLYREIPITHKEMLIKELDKKYFVLEKNKTRKLF